MLHTCVIDMNTHITCDRDLHMNLHLSVPVPGVSVPVVTKFDPCLVAAFRSLGNLK